MLMPLFNPVTGKPVNNHIIRREGKDTILYSYCQPVAKVRRIGHDYEFILAPEAMEHSRTTNKYILLFAHIFCPETQSCWRVPADICKALVAEEIMVAPIN